MISMNYELLSANIKDLIKQKKLTQAQLAEKIGMSQSNLSKCLQENKKNRLTLDEVYSISVVFNKTIDDLIGNSIESKQSSNETICRLLESLLNEGRIEFIDHEASELTPSPEIDEIGEPMYYEKKSSTYKAIYFPNYRHDKDYYDDARRDSLAEKDYEIAENMKINAFLKSYLAVYEQYDKGEYSLDEFSRIKNALFSILQ